MNLKVLITVSIAAFALVGASWFSFSRGPSTPVQSPVSMVASTAAARPPNPVAAQTKPGSLPISAGKPVSTSTSATPTTLQTKHATSNPNDFVGKVQPVPANANVQVAAVAEALKDHNHPERLSLMAAATPFDAAAFAKDPQTYINDPQPARVYQTAAPAEGVPVLVPLGSILRTMPQDGQIILRVRTVPRTPATFTSADLGRFGNQLTTQTVIADDHGIASVSFSAGPGTIAGVHVLAGSNAASGQVLFTINVQAPTGKDPGNG